MKVRYRIIKFVETRTRDRIDGSPRDMGHSEVHVREVSEPDDPWPTLVIPGTCQLLRGLIYDPAAGPVGMEFDVEVTQVTEPSPEIQEVYAL